jgi:hypothetical protein
LRAIERQAVAQSPELLLIARASRRLGRPFCERMIFERQIARVNPYLAGVDEILSDVFKRGLMTGDRRDTENR